MQWTRTASLCSPLTPTVRCASEEEHVSHPAPYLSNRVPSVPPLAPEPHRGAWLTRSPSKLLVNARLGPNCLAFPASGRLVLAQLARTQSSALGSNWRFPMRVATTYIRAVALQPCQNTGVLEMPGITAHHLLGAPSAPPFPANTTRALVASPRSRPHAGAIAASTRPSNPACSRLAQLRCARR